MPSKATYLMNAVDEVIIMVYKSCKVANKPLSSYSYTTYRIKIVIFFFYYNLMANYNGKYYIYNKNGNDNFLKAIKSRKGDTRN